MNKIIPIVAWVSAAVLVGAWIYPTVAIPSTAGFVAAGIALALSANSTDGENYEISAPKIQPYVRAIILAMLAAVVYYFYADPGRVMSASPLLLPQAVAFGEYATMHLGSAAFGLFAFVATRGFYFRDDHLNLVRIGGTASSVIFGILLLVIAGPIFHDSYFSADLGGMLIAGSGLIGVALCVRLVFASRTTGD